MKNVVVGIIVKEINHEKAYLLISVEKADFGKYSGCYYPPGGHVENGETESTALIRELKEELDITVKPTRKITQITGDLGEQTYFWECKILNGEPKNLEKHKDVGFFTEKQISELSLWPTTENFFKNYIFNN